MKTILNLAWKELLQLWRDRLLLVFIILMPVLQLYLIANATGSGIHNIQLAVWDQDRTPLSQQLVTALDNTDVFTLAYRANSYTEVESLIKEGRAAAALIIPPNFTRESARPDGHTSLSVIIDGTNTLIANNLLSAMNSVVNNMLVLPSGEGQALGGIDLKIDLAFNATLNLRWSMMPSQLAFITYQLVLVIAAVGLVRERELGTMEQLVVTPINRLDLLLGKGLMAAVIGALNLVLLFFLLLWGFQVPMRGSIVLFFGLGMLFVAAEIGVGTLISLISSTQQQAILIVFLFAILEVTFSGYLVPPDNMPAFMQALAAVSPLQHFMEIVKSIFLKGSTLTMLARHVVPLVVLALGSLGAAWVMFSRSE